MDVFSKTVLSRLIFLPLHPSEKKLVSTVLKHWTSVEQESKRIKKRKRKEKKRKKKGKKKRKKERKKEDEAEEIHFLLWVLPPVGITLQPWATVTFYFSRI